MKKTMTKFLLTAILIFVLSIATVFSGQSMTAYAAENVTTEPLSESSIQNNPEPIEVKSFCKATIEDDFADDAVLVVLNKESSDVTKKESTTQQHVSDSFSSVTFEKVEELTLQSSERLSKQIIEKEERQRLINGETKQGGTNDLERISAIDFSEKTGSIKEINPESYRKILRLELKKKGKQNVLNAIKELEAREDVLTAEPDYYFTSCSTTPNEYPYLTANMRWGFDKIGMPNAWDIATGSNSVSVGILDAGIDSFHPDLTNRVDRNLSRDFTGQSTVVVQNPTDEDSHGTLVAGVIGAEAKNYVNNGKTSMMGVCWDVNLVSLKVRNANEDGSAESAVRAIDFASSVGIQILNFSHTVDIGSNALKQAIMNYPGLFVCAAGNNNRNTDVTPSYPSAYTDLDNLISVGATKSDDSRPDVSDWGYDNGSPQGSNYGMNTVDIYAPGDWIYSTLPTALHPDAFAYEFGTSMAAPFVSGVAALIVSVHPDFDAATIKYAIMGGSEQITISTPDGTQNVRRLRADMALAQAAKIPNFPELSVKASGWDINVRNNNTQENMITYNERMCFAGDAMNFYHLTNLRSFKLSPGGERAVRITPFGTGTHIAVAIAFTLDNGDTIYRVSYADGLYANGMNVPKHVTVGGGAMGNADLVPNYLDFELTARYGIAPYEWDVKLINNNFSAVSVTYNSRMCYDDAARNFMGLRDLADVYIPGSTYSSGGGLVKGSATVRISGNGVAHFITAAINYTVDGTRFRRVSSADGLTKHSENSYSTSTVRHHEVQVSSCFPVVSSHPANLTMTPVSKSGFIFYTWVISIQNNSDFAIEVSYNAKLCFEGDARNFEGLADIVTISIPKRESRNVTINHNGTAGWISASINYSYGGDEYRRITYADGLAVNPNKTNNPKYNLIRFV